MAQMIVIDGLDGSGKATQSKILAEKLRGEGKKVRHISFPMYDNPSCTLVKMYLNGEIGKSAGETNAYAASMLFAADRYVSFKNDWSRDYESNDTVILADRYTSANAVHQLSKLDRGLWNEFLSWLSDFEHNKLMLPKPDAVIYLEMPYTKSIELIESRSSETGRVKDIHENDTDFLKKSYEAALFASRALDWEVVRCLSDGRLRAIDDIALEVRKKVKEKIGI